MAGKGKTAKILDAADCALDLSTNGNVRVKLNL